MVLLANSIDTDNVMTVTELVHQIRQSVEQNFSRLVIVGEMSSFKAWRSGHWYFDLKDEGALISAVMFQRQCSQVKFQVEDGMEVLIVGKVSLYAPQSKIQIIVESMEPVGQGALALAFEQLKKKLEAEGLFSAAHKIPIPRYPQIVGLVTSPQGAVLRDMLRILKERMPELHIIIAPTRVQGDGSAAEIADAIRRLDQDGRCDVMIVGRGGGSLEDLWAFNEEVVARAIYACKTPIVSAVGHETDFSIADFVADLRCATPTHAAQEVVPNITELRDLLLEKQRQLGHNLRMLVSNSSLRLERLAKKIRQPQLLIFPYVKKVDELGYRLDQAMQKRFKLPREQIATFAAKLHALSPLDVLARGYAVAQLGETVLNSVKLVHVGDAISIRVSDGQIDAEVRKIYDRN